MRIAYIPSDFDAPGCYRCLFPARQLAEKGGHSVVLPHYTIDLKQDGTYLTKMDIDLDPPRPMADLWVLQQRNERWWGEDGINKLRKYGIATVADVDDNYEELPAWNPAFEGTHPYRKEDGGVVNRAERRRIAQAMKIKKLPPNKANRMHMFETFRRVDAMTVSTPYLKRIYGSYNEDITVVRNYLDWDIWESVKPQYEVKRWQNRIRIGYLGVFRFHSGDLAIVKKVIPKILNLYPQVDFVANSKEAFDYLEVPQKRRVLVKEYSFYRHDNGPYRVGNKTAVCDIGLVPLTLTGMNEGKSHLKGMEYNAAGMPYLASPTESYLYWTDEWENGVTCHTEKEWHDNLCNLIEHEEMRRKMGLLGRVKASEHTFQNNWHEWEDVYSRLLGDYYTGLARGAVARNAVQKVSELGNFLRLAAQRKIRTVVEIGSAWGGTFWAFSQIAGDNAILISIDIPAGSPIDATPQGEDRYPGRDRRRFQRLIRDTQTMHLVDADSQSEETLEHVKGLLRGRPIDLLFIDGDHRYQGVKRDYELWSPLVRDGGIVGFHDVIPQNDPRSGVHLLWRELRQKHPSRTQEWVGTDGHGVRNWGGVGALTVSNRV